MYYGGVGACHHLPETGKTELKKKREKGKRGGRKQGVPTAKQCPEKKGFDLGHRA